MKFATTVSTVLAFATFAFAAPPLVSEVDLQIIKDIVEGADKIRDAAGDALERRACDCAAYEKCRRRCGAGQSLIPTTTHPKQIT